MKFKVIVSIELIGGASPEDAEIDEGDLVDHEYIVDAKNKHAASEAALDWFHSSIPIGDLGCVRIDTEVSTV
jgi:hypothetical protein